MWSRGMVFNAIRKKKRKKKTNQKISNWSFGKVYSLLEYKLKAKGIAIEKVDERYTSQTCPGCWETSNAITTKVYQLIHFVRG